jgi:hypothetical protein
MSYLVVLTALLVAVLSASVIVIGAYLVVMRKG